MATIKAIKLINSSPVYSNLLNKSLIITNEYKKFCPQLIIRTVKKRFSNIDRLDPLKPPKELYSIAETVPKNERIAALRTSYAKTILPKDLEQMRCAYPEFFLSPNLEHRNELLDSICRRDMLKRRAIIDIPEFYVGSILAVTISDPYAPGKVSRFLGICIERLNQGLKANFTLRNRIENQGVEIRYDMYNPTIREIQVIRLEKRLDDNLTYLRDALPEYSYFPQDMSPEPHKPGDPVPVNEIKVEMKKWPWSKRWEYKTEVRGIGVMADLPDWRYLMAWPSINHLEKYDLMKQYRETTSEDDLLEMLEQIKEHQENVMEMRRAERRKKLLSHTSGDKPTDRK